MIASTNRHRGLPTDRRGTAAHGRTLPAHLYAGPGGGGALAIGLRQAMGSLLSALYSFPGGYLADRIGTAGFAVFGRDMPVPVLNKEVHHDASQ